MTYLIVGNKEENIKESIYYLLKKHWGRDIKEEIFSSQNPDVHILNGTNLNSIGIEDVKSLQKEMVYTPFKEKVQTAIVFEADRLTTQAQNSFLKTLEESSNTTMYIFVTKNENNLLPTIISRCSKIYTKESREELNEVESIDIFKMDLVQAFSKIEEIAKERKDTEEFLKSVELILQKSLENKVQEGSDIDKICSSIEKVVKTRKRVDANGNRKLLLEGLYLDITR